MRLLILLILLTPLTFLSLEAQSSTIEKLKLKLEQSGQDTSRIRILNELTKQIRSSNLDSAWNYARQASRLSVQLEDKEGQFTSLLIISQYLAGKDSSIFFAEQARTIAIETADKKKLAESLLQLGNCYSSRFERVTALDYYHQSLQAAIEANDVSRQFFPLNEIGKNHMYAARHKEAEQAFLQALEISKKIKNKRWQTGILQNLGNNAARGNQVDIAVDYYQQAILILNDLDNQVKVALMLQLIAYTYMQTGFYPRALEYYQKSLSIYESQKDTINAMKALAEIASLFELMRDYEKALSYRQQLLEYYNKTGDLYFTTFALNSLGENFHLQEKYDTALIYFYQALGLQKNSSIQSKIDTYRHIGSTYEKTDQLDSASIYLLEALSLSRKMQDRTIIASCLISIGGVYKKQNNIAKAKSTWEEALVFVRKTGNRKQEMEVRTLLFQLYEDQGNFQAALNNYKSFREIQDSLFNDKNTREFALLEAEVKFDKEKQQLEFTQERQLRKQRSSQNLTIGALAIAILLVFIFAWYYRQKQRSNAKLRRLNERLEDLDNMKSRFFTNISHEFRTPLTVIGGMVDQMEAAPQKWLDKGLQLIRRNNQNLLDLVNQILDLRKLESGGLQLKLVQGDLIKYLRYILESFHSMAENKGVALHFQSKESILITSYDQEKVLRIISNLLSNAIKFTSKGGSVYLTVDGPRTTIDSTSPSPPSSISFPFLLIKINDTGIGIPEEKIPYIFDRFYQVDDSSTRQGEGTGIGLTLTQELLKMMGGQIQLLSKVGEGTTFFIRLPINNEASMTADDGRQTMDKLPFSVPAMQTDRQQPKIENRIPNTENGQPSLLIIEDNPDVVQYLEIILEDHYQLSIAMNGQEGIDKALELVPDLIISDVMMPEKDGFEVCETLKTDERTSHIPIVLLTAKADAASRIAGLKRGADAYLAKPFNQEELLVRLQKLAELRLLLQKRYQGMDALPPADDLATSLEDAFILKIKEAILNNLEEPAFDTVRLCKTIGLGRSQLHAKLKALTGKTPALYIRSIRLHKAKELLKSSALNITQIAYEVGFQDPAYFSRTFAKEFGQPPKHFR